MENKLHQIVYTRCSHHRDIKNGTVSRSDGYGIFSMDKELFADIGKVDIQLISKLLPPKNAASESSIGLFNSYEYYPVSGSDYAFAYEFSRPKGTVPRKNGISHRPGNYVKQCLIGQAEGYPYQWFGSDMWNAWKVPENDYYLDDGSRREPEFLPVLSFDKSSKGNINYENIQKFVHGGRQELIKQAVWFLINEGFDTEKSRVLFIKDYPQNVELWIAAIESCFTPEIARQISFITNRTNISKVSNDLFYYTDESGKFSYHSGKGAKRRPYYMITGIHPEDRFVSSIVPCDNLVMLDGIKKTFSVQPDERINAKYYNAVFDFSDDLYRFCTAIMTKFSIKDVKTIPEFYDSVKILVNPEIISEENYQNLLAKLQFLSNAEVKDSSVFIPILEKLNGEYSRFINDEINNSFRLLELEKEYEKKTARQFKLEKIVYEYIDKAAADKNMLNTEFIPAMSAFDNYVKKSPNYSAIKDYLLTKIFNKISSKFLLDGIEIKTIIFLVDLYAEYITIKSKASDFIPNIDLVSVLLNSIWVKGRNNFLLELKKILSASRDFGIKVIEELLKNEKNNSDFWNEVLNADEQFFIDSVKKGSIGIKILMIVLRQNMLDKRKDGIFCIDLFSLCLSASSASNAILGIDTVFLFLCTDNVSDKNMSTFIEKIMKMNLEIEIQKNIFRHIDKRTALNSIFLQKMESWGSFIREEATVSYIKKFSEEIKKLSLKYSIANTDYETKKRIKEEASNVLDKFKSKSIPYQTFSRQPSYTAFFADIAVIFEEEVHKKGMEMLFCADAAEIYKYLYTYISSVVNHYESIEEKKGWFSKQNKLSDGLAVIAEALLLMNVPGTLFSAMPKKENDIKALKQTGMRILETIVKDKANKKLLSQITEHYKKHPEYQGVKQIGDWIREKLNKK